MERSEKICTCVCSRVSYYFIMYTILIIIMMPLADLFAIAAPFTQTEYNIRDKHPNSATE